jgi:hypothetical protein
MDTRGARADGGEKYLWGRYGEVRPVMLAEADAIDADLIGEHRLIHHVSDDLRMAQ